MHREAAQRRNEEDRELYAIRRIEAAMGAAATRLEHRLRSFEEDMHRAEQAIIAEWTDEHWGQRPERPPAWEAV